MKAHHCHHLRPSKATLRALRAQGRKPAFISWFRAELFAVLKIDGVANESNNPKGKTPRVVQKKRRMSK